MAKYFQQYKRCVGGERGRGSYKQRVGVGEGVIASPQGTTPLQEDKAGHNFINYYLKSIRVCWLQQIAHISTILELRGLEDDHNIFFSDVKAGKVLPCFLPPPAPIFTKLVPFIIQPANQLLHFEQLLTFLISCKLQKIAISIYLLLRCSSRLCTVGARGGFWKLGVKPLLSIFKATQNMYE